MRKDDAVRLQHTPDAGREALGFARVPEKRHARREAEHLPR
jgi:hypothetical protein